MYIYFTLLIKIKVHTLELKVKRSLLFRYIMQRVCTHISGELQKKKWFVQISEAAFLAYHSFNVNTYLCRCL